MEPQAYEKFCDDSVFVTVNILASKEEVSFDLGFSAMDSINTKNQMLVDRIDDVLNQNRESIYDQESIDDAQEVNFLRAVWLTSHPKDDRSAVEPKKLSR